jgi:hypothetical protein
VQKIFSLTSFLFLAFFIDFVTINLINPCYEKLSDMKDSLGKVIFQKIKFE